MSAGEIAANMAVFEFHRMYQATGMLHGDFHEGNIMVHPNYYYLHGMPRGRVVIIDFGASFLSPDRVPLDIRKTQDLIRQYMKYPSPTWGAEFIPNRFENVHNFCCTHMRQWRRINAQNFEI
jgi:hypothetical protein